MEGKWKVFSKKIKKIKNKGAEQTKIVCYRFATQSVVQECSTVAAVMTMALFWPDPSHWRGVHGAKRETHMESPYFYTLFWIPET